MNLSLNLSKWRSKWSAVHWREEVSKGAIAIVIGVIASYVIPLVMGEEFLVRQVARVYAPWAGAWHGNEQRDEVSVMLVDDTSLQSAGQSWPADYGYYARLLDALTLYKPRAVFIDVVFAAERKDPSIERLLAAACRAHAAGIKLYFAARRDPAGHFLLRPDLEALAPACLQKVAVEYDPDAVDQTAWTYPVAADSDAPDGAIRSAAGSIYRDMGGVMPKHQHAELAVNWGLQPAERGIDWLQLQPAPAHGGAHGEEAHTPHDAKAASYCRAAGNPLFEALPAFVRRQVDAAATKPICVFHNTLYPSDLQTTSDEEEKRLAEHLSGRVVMLGTALQGSNDRVLSPLHGRIPGVYMHAMALDNLLTYGDRYHRAAHLGATSDGMRVLGLLVAGLLLVVFGRLLLEPYSKKKESSGSGKWSQFSTWAGRLLVKTIIYLCFIFAMLAAGRWLFGLGFLTVIHVALFSFAAEWLEWNEGLWDWLKGPSAEGAHDSHTGNTQNINQGT